MSQVRELLSPRGRIGWAGYWQAHLVQAAGFVVGAGAVSIARGEQASSLLVAFFLMTWGVGLWVSIAATIKRFHDRGKSGWWLLLMFVPLVQLWLLIELGFFEGEAHTNRFGARP